MENANQNQINVTQARLDEMKAIKEANQKVLDDIDANTQKLNKLRADFQAYKDSTETRLTDERKLLARESANHAKLDTVVMQEQIDDLTAQVASLTKINDGLASQNKELTEQVSSLQHQA